MGRGDQASRQLLWERRRSPSEAVPAARRLSCPKKLRPGTQGCGWLSQQGGSEGDQGLDLTQQSSAARAQGFK